MDMNEKVNPEYHGQPLGWWAGTNPEFMNIGGPFPSREQAISEGRSYQNGEPFYIIEAAIQGWSAPCAEDVIERWCENADEYFYEDCFDGFVGGKEAELEAENDLQRVLNEWFLRHKDICPTPTVFATRGAAEAIDLPAPVEAEPERKP